MDSQIQIHLFKLWYTGSYLTPIRIYHGPLQQRPWSPNQFLIQSTLQPSSQTLALPQASSQTLALPQASSQTQTLPQPSSQTRFLLQPSSQTQFLPQASSQTLPLPQASSQTLPLPQASSQTKILPQPSSQTRFLLQPSSQTQSLPQASSQTVPLLQASSQTLPLPQASSQTLPLPQASSQTQILPQASSQTQTLPQPSSQTQSLPQPSSQTQSLPQPTPQFLIWPPTRSLSLPPAQLLSLPPAQLLSLPPAQSLSSVQSLSLFQFLSKSDSKSLSDPEPLIKPLSDPEPLNNSLSDPEPLLMAQINSQRNDQSKSYVSRNYSSNSKCYKKWMVQSEESLQKQNAVFHKASFGQVLFCCLTLDSEWFFYLEEIGLPVKACRDELKNSLTYEDLDCMLIIEDIFTTLIHLTKDHTYLMKMLDAVEKLEKAVLKDEDILVTYLLEKAHLLQVVQQTWKEVSTQSDVSEQKKFLTLFLMKLYQQHINDFNNSIDSWEKIKKLSVNGTYVADTLQEKGEEELKNGNLKDALGFFNDAINNCPLDVTSYKQRAKIHEMLKNYKLSSCDLIRVHILEPDWEEGYTMHDKILKNLDEQWTTFYFKLINKWKQGAYSCQLKTVVEDTEEKKEKENYCIGAPLKVKEKKNEEKTSSVWIASDNLLKKAMNLYKQQKFKEMLQLFKANILETTLYQLALLSLIHLKQFDEARQLAVTAIEAFTDHRQFSGDKVEIIASKKMFNFIKSLPPSPFGQCEICKTDQQSSVANIYLCDDFSMLDDIFHKGCIMLSCENRCRILFHFECLSGSNDFVWEESSLQNYIRTMCSTPDCQSFIIVAEAFSVNNTKTVKVVDNDLGFKRPEINHQTEISKINLKSQNPIEQNNNIISILTSSDEAVLPSDHSDSSTQDMAHSSQPTQDVMLNETKDTKSLPSYKEYQKKKTGKNKKRAEKKVPLTENVEFYQEDNNLNPNLTNGFQPEANKKEEQKQFFSESTEEIEKDHLLLYLCSVLHTHGPQSASGEIFQNEIKALSDNHKKLLSKSGGLASFLLQSNNVLLKDPDILFLEADTLTTVIPATEDLPLQSNLLQASATGEDFASSTLPMHSLYKDNDKQYAASGRDNPLNRSVGNSDFEFALRAAFGPEFNAERQKVHGINPENASACASIKVNQLDRSGHREIFEMGNAVSEDFEILERKVFDTELEAQTQNVLDKNPDGISVCAGETSESPSRSLKLDSEEELQSRNSPPDKEEVNILDLSTSEFDTSSSSSEQEPDTGEENDFFSYSEQHSSTESSDLECSFNDFCARKCKPRIAYLEEESRKLSVLFNTERRHHEMAKKKISSLEEKLKALEEENENLKRFLEVGDGAQDTEASYAARATVSKSTLKAGRRSLPSHLKSSQLSCQPKEEFLPQKKEEDINMCVICHEDIFLFTINTLQCGHVFHDKCVRKWFKEQKTCPSCRKHALLTDEFPPLA